MTHSRHCRCFSALSLFCSRLVFVHSKDSVVLPQNDVHTEFIRKKSRYETRSWLGLARPPEADLDGVGICEVAAVVPHPVFPSTGPLDHSPKLPGFSMGNPASGCYGLVWPSFMDELWLVVMVCPASDQQRHTCLWSSWLTLKLHRYSAYSTCTTHSPVLTFPLPSYSAY